MAHIDIIGSGFVVLPDGTGIPGIFGNNRITAKGEVVPVLQTPETTSDVPPVQTEQPTPPSDTAQPIKSSSSSSESNGG